MSRHPRQPRPVLPRHPYRVRDLADDTGRHTVIDRETGHTVGTVRRTPDFDRVMWAAEDVDGRTVPGPHAADLFATRADAAAAVWAERNLDDLAADDVMEDQAADETLLDAACDVDDSALVAQFNDTRSLS